MENKEQQELIEMGLGLYSGLFGVGFLFFPGLMNSLTGFNLAESSNKNLVIRLLGVRDLSLGAGLLLRRGDPEEKNFWLKMLAANVGGDGVLLAISFPKSENKPKTFLGVVLSAIVAGLALRGTGK